MGKTSVIKLRQIKEMRKIIKLSGSVGCMWLLLSINLYAQAKIHYLPADTLLRWFENSHHPLDVWDSIYTWERKTPGLHIYDYKAYYNSPSLKPYLLKWLDRDLYYHLRLKELRESYFPDSKEDSAYMTYKINGRLKQKKSALSIDTILNTPKLYFLYIDSILSDIVEQNRREFERKGKPFPGNRAIDFHMRLAYPESYEQIRSFWEETGKERNEYFIPLVRMGDPEARKIYDAFIKQVVETNGENTFLNSLLSIFSGSLHTSYGMSKLIELLEVDAHIDPFSDGNTKPFKCEAIKILISSIFGNHIQVDPVVKYRDPCEKHLEHLKEIKEAARRLIEYYKEQEYYWMSDMPFYKE